MAADEEGELALSPYRVLDLADGKGVYASKVLADLGADVIKIEPPQGDPTRNTPPFVADVPHPERSLYWLYRNANKRGVTLNLETQEGQGIFKRLVKTTDVLFEAFAPGYLTKLGLGYPVLREVNPGLIHVSITNFGHSGPYTDYKAAEITAWAMSGGMWGSGLPEQPPIHAPGYLAYDAAAAYAVAGASLALYHKSTTGQGQYIEISMHEAALAALVPWSISGYSYQVAGGTQPGRRERPRLSGRAYACKDGYMFITLLAPPAVKAFLELLGNPEELMRPPWDDLGYRLTHMVEFGDLTYKYLKDFTREEIFHKGQALGLPCWPANTPADMFEDPHHKERGFWLEVEHSEHGKARYAGAPWKLSETPVRSRRPAPRLGEHNREVYGQELGYSDEEISALRAAGII